MQSRAESYRELAMKATNSIAEYKARAERYSRQGDAQNAAECQQRANEAAARAKRYLLLADFAERNSKRTKGAPPG